ncbi:acyltransferase [Stieleria varia]|uniref:UDP-2-acetamido-3-amino-2, 3-dideoxy-D-glucuronate N-acetyltransferase n=1 Tax=Stieleria varia TaxID=2528005 RepID=A0A5C6AMJ3_9BACT|nr:acyltransferase [Stieleria varia]TWU01283.1 UDP-2-acetamido-3-amino-2,3-dideoxy-D-glucuronate N-acetyltransferase [Stieleria varia]
MNAHDSDNGGGTARSADVRRTVAPTANVGIKRSVQFAFLILALPRLLCYGITKRVIGSRALTSSSESIARVPGLRGVYLRQAFYRQVLSQCGRDVYLGWGSVFSMQEARVGERAYIGRNCSIGYADIGQEVMLADGVQILSGGREHDSTDSQRSMHDQGQTYQQVRIGDGAWIGAGAILMADIGEHAIVGAGAVVNRPIPAFSIAVGVPARVVKTRFLDPDSHSDAASPNQST